MIIYKTTNLVNNKIYIGRDIHNNPKYLGSGTVFRFALKKYGKSNFKKETLESCDSLALLNEREKFWIQHLNSTNRNVGYNIALGGDGNSSSWNGPHLTESHKQNISNGLKNSIKFQNMWNGNHRDKLKIARKNSKVVYDLFKDDEWRKKVSDGVKNSDKFQTAVKSKERNDKISKSLKSSKKFKESRGSIEFRNKCIQREKNNPKSKEFYQKVQLKRDIKIKYNQEVEKQGLINVLIQYTSIKDIAKALNITETSVYRKLKKFNLDRNSFKDEKPNN